MFDTYAAAKALRNAGFDEPQAEAAVAMVRDAVSEGVATGEDAARLESKIDAGLAEVKTEIAEVKAGLAEVKTEIAEVKTEIAEVKTDVVRLEGRVESESARLEGRVESEIGRLETRLTVRMYGGLVATAAVVVALLKLLP